MAGPESGVGAQPARLPLLAKLPRAAWAPPAARTPLPAWAVVGGAWAVVGHEVPLPPFQPLAHLLREVMGGLRRVSLFSSLDLQE